MGSTVIIQSFRDYDVPEWLQLCLQSVRDYTEYKGYTYRFIGDEFFDLTPAKLRNKCGDNIFAITDIARLVAIKNLHDEGFEKVIWVDADVLVFGPHILKIDNGLDHGFAHELLVAPFEGDYTIISSVNNAVMFFNRHSTVLSNYYHAILYILDQLDGKVPRTALGPSLLPSLIKSRDELLFDVGLFTLDMMKEIVTFGSDSIIKNYESVEGVRIGAANLCNFQRSDFRGAERHEFDRIYKKAVTALLGTYV